MMWTRSILRSASARGRALGRSHRHAPLPLSTSQGGAARAASRMPPFGRVPLPELSSAPSPSAARERFFSVRTRFAPSPTGSLHIGGLRTALFNYLYAKRMGGQFILRIEDTDKVREVPGSVADIQGMLEWCGIVPDEGPPDITTTDADAAGGPGDCGPYTQSERLPLYHEHCQRLVDSGAAYPCFCSKGRLAELKQQQQQRCGNGSDGDGDGSHTHHRSGYDGHCSHIDPAEARRRVEAGEPHTVRLRVPRGDGRATTATGGAAMVAAGEAGGLCGMLSSLCESGRTVAFEDELRGTIRVDLDRVDDQVLMKSDGFPTYHLASVVDDHLMGITHVIRGQEWLLSTPKHALLYDALGWPRPRFLHLPLLLNEDRSKMSKRKGDVSVRSFRRRGFTGDAMINFVALLGWTPASSAAFAGRCSPPGDTADEAEFTDLFTLDELVAEFDVARLSASPAVVSLEKLRWMNACHIQRMNACPDKRPRLLSELRRSFLPACDHPDATVAGALAAMAKFNELDADRSGFLEGSELEVLSEWARDGLGADGGRGIEGGDVDGGEDACAALRAELTARLVAKMDTDGDGRLSFEEFEGWFRHTRAGLVRLLSVAAAPTAASSSSSSSSGGGGGGGGGSGDGDGDNASSAAPPQQRPFVCRQDPNWPSDTYLAAAVDHLGKRLTSLADFPDVGEYLFRAPCFRPGGAGGVVAASMLAKHGGDPAEVTATLALLHQSFAEEVGDEGSGAFESPESVKAFMTRFAKRNGIKPRQLMFPARVALTGTAQGGPFFEMIFLLGRAETLRRLEAFEAHVKEYVITSVGGDGGDEEEGEDDNNDTAVLLTESCDPGSGPTAGPRQSSGRKQRQQ